MASNKMDMSLDQIIKLQNKEKQSFKTQTGGGRARGRGGVGRGRGGIGRGGGARRGGVVKVGVATGLRARRLGVEGGARQRLAQNLVKRAMLQRRRQAISARNAANAATVSGGQPANTRRLLQEVRHWRQTAQVLQTALVQQQRTVASPNKIRLRRPGNNNFQSVETTSGIQNRLGWRGRSNRSRGGINQRISVRQNPRRISGAFGQMQSDVLSRDEARQQRLANEILTQTLQTIGGGAARRSRGGRGRARGGVRRQIFTDTNVQVARNNMNRRFGGQSSFGGSQLRQIGDIVWSNNSGRRGRGAKRGASIRNGVVLSNNRESVNTFRSAFVSSNTSGTTLNERFGGGGGAGVGVNVRGGRFRGGGRRGRNRRSYGNY